MATLIEPSWSWLSSPSSSPPPPPFSSSLLPPSSSWSEEEERVKSICMLYRWDEGPILYSLYALNNVGTTTRWQKNPVPRPWTILGLPRDKYPLGMGFVKLDSKIYFIGGQFKEGDTIFASKKVYVLDLCSSSSSSSSRHHHLDDDELLIECPNMNAGKSNPLVTVVNGKIYVLACSIDVDPNIGSLVPIPPHYAPDDTTEISKERVVPYSKTKMIFEVFDPNSDEWTVLPQPPPPPYRIDHFPAIIIGHAVVHDKIVFYSGEGGTYFFDVKTKQWNVVDPDEHDNKTFYDALGHAFSCHGRGIVGRSLIVDGTLYATAGYPTSGILAYHIDGAHKVVKVKEESTSFPFGPLTGLRVPVTWVNESTGGSLALGPQLVYLGDEKFCLVSAEGSYLDATAKLERGDVTITIFQVIKYKTPCDGTIRCSADVLDSYVIKELDPASGSFFYCFALKSGAEYKGMRSIFESREEEKRKSKIYTDRHSYKALMARPKQQPSSFLPPSSMFPYPSSSSPSLSEEGVKSVCMFYRWDQGPVIYSLYALNNVCSTTCPRKNPPPCPVTILELCRDKYPLGMGFLKLDSKIYFIGGQFKQGETIVTSKKVYVLDLGTLNASSRPNDVEKLLIEGPKMNAGKPNPLVIAAHGKIYVLASFIDNDPNTSSLGHLPNYDHDDVTELSEEPSNIFEVFDPESDEWTVLPEPPRSFMDSFLTLISGHAVVHDKIFLSSAGGTTYFYDVKTKQWDWFDVDNHIVSNSNDFLAHAFLCHGRGLIGRGLVVDGTLYALGGRPTFAVFAYDMSLIKEDMSFPFGPITGLRVPTSCRLESTGRSLATAADLVHLGDGKFCLIFEEDNERAKHDVFITIFEIYKYERSCDGTVYCAAEILDSYVIKGVDAHLGSFFYCFALDGRIAGRCAAGSENAREGVDLCTVYAPGRLSTWMSETVLAVLVIGIGMVAATCRQFHKSIVMHQKKVAGEGQGRLSALER